MSSCQCHSLRRVHDCQQSALQACPYALLSIYFCCDTDSYIAASHAVLHHFRTPLLKPGNFHAQVDARQILKHPPVPLATLALQKEAITYLRMPGERMMKIAEELYQGGFISYPRTETDCFDPAYDLKVCSLLPRTPSLTPIWSERLFSLPALVEKLYQEGFISFCGIKTDSFDPAYDFKVCCEPL